MDFENKKIRRSPNQVSCELDGETVIMDSKSGEYFKMNSLGTRIWELITEPLAIRLIIEKLLAEYATDPKTCKDEVEIFISDLLNKKLVTAN